MYNKRTLNKDTKASKEPKSISTPRDIIYDPMGQWTNPYQPTRVPSSNITMQGVPYPVLGIGSTGQQQIMYPGGEYMFPGSEYVDEFPKTIMQDGGFIDIELTDEEIDEYKKGGYIVEEYNNGGIFGKSYNEKGPFINTDIGYDSRYSGMKAGAYFGKSFRDKDLGQHSVSGGLYGTKDGLGVAGRWDFQNPQGSLFRNKPYYASSQVNTGFDKTRGVYADFDAGLDFRLIDNKKTKATIGPRGGGYLNLPMRSTNLIDNPNFTNVDFKEGIHPLANTYDPGSLTYGLQGKFQRDTDLGRFKVSAGAYIDAIKGKRKEEQALLDDDKTTTYTTTAGQDVTIPAYTEKLRIAPEFRGSISWSPNLRTASQRKVARKIAEDKKEQERSKPRIGFKTGGSSLQNESTIPKFQTGNGKRLTPQELIAAQREQQLQNKQAQYFINNPVSPKDEFGNKLKLPGINAPIPKSMADAEGMIQRKEIIPESLASTRVKQARQAEERKQERIRLQEDYAKRQANPEYSSWTGLPGESWRETLAAEAAPMEAMFRVSNEDNFFDDYINPAVWIGSMAKGLGEAPKQSKETGSYLPYVTGIGMPLLGGALGSIGTKTTGQFANNLVNPLAGVNIRNTPKDLPGSGVNASSFRDVMNTPQDYNIQELRRALHNNERVLMPEEFRFLDKHGRGAREEYSDYWDDITLRPGRQSDENLLNDFWDDGSLMSGDQLDLFPDYRDINTRSQADDIIDRFSSPSPEQIRNRALTNSRLSQQYAANNYRPMFNQLSNIPAEIQVMPDGSWLDIDKFIKPQDYSSIIDFTNPVSGNNMSRAEMRSVMDFLDTPEITNFTKPSYDIDRLAMDYYKYERGLPPVNYPNLNRAANMDQLYLATTRPGSPVRTPAKVKNKSGLTKEEALKKATAKDKDTISKMSEEDFANTVLKPNGEVVPYVQGKRAEGVIPIDVEEYADEWNSRLDKLNEIVADNNKTGITIEVTDVKPNGIFTIHTPKQTLPDGRVIEAGNSQLRFNMRPGRWRGEVENIASREYQRSIPGLSAFDTSQGLFPAGSGLKGTPGTGFYDSLNTFMKKYDLGRLADGDSGQTKDRLNQYGKIMRGSFPVWESKVKSNKAVGFYSNEGNQINAIYRSLFPGLLAGYSGYKLLEGDNSDYQQGGIVLDLSDDEIRKYQEAGYVTEEYQDGGDVKSSHGWDYKKEGDKYFTKKIGTDKWIEPTGEALKAIQQKVFGDIEYTESDRKSDYINNVQNLISSGYTLDDLVKQRVGTKEGLIKLFPELSETKSTTTAKSKKVTEEPAEEVTAVEEVFPRRNPISLGLKSYNRAPGFLTDVEAIKARAMQSLATSKAPTRMPVMPVMPSWQEHAFAINEGLEKPEYTEAELTDEEIAELQAQGHIVEEVTEPEPWLNSLQNNVSQQSIYNTDNVTLDPFERTPKYGPTEEQMLKLQEFMKTPEEKGLKSWKPELISLKGLGDPAMGPGGFSYTLGKDSAEKIKDPEGIVQKGLTYVGEAPWLSPSELPNYFSQLKDTKDRSEGNNLKEEKVVETPELNIDVIEDKKQFFNEFPIVKKSSNYESFTDALGIIDPYKQYKPSVLPTSTQRFIFNKDTEEIDEDALYKASNRNKNKISLGKSYEDIYGQTYSKQNIDMSDGIFVTYQPRQERENERTDVENSLFISDYLYDQDFTDGYKHSYAESELNNLKNDILNNNKTDRKFATIRIPTNNPNEFIVKVVNINELTEQDFDEDNVYRQSYAKLSDLQLSEDGKKIKLDSRDSNFANQGILLTTKETKNSTKTLRVSGGKGNYGDKWLEIDKLNQFGPYLGGTVTIISDDGSIVKKVTGGLKDILETALAIKKASNGKEVHFLQSDSGSMNVKPLAVDGTIDKKMLGTQRNKEPWAGASEILLNK